MRYIVADAFGRNNKAVNDRRNWALLSKYCVGDTEQRTVGGRWAGVHYRPTVWCRVWSTYSAVAYPSLHRVPWGCQPRQHHCLRGTSAKQHDLAAGKKHYPSLHMVIGRTNFKASYAEQQGFTPTLIKDMYLEDEGWRNMYSTVLRILYQGD